MPRLRLCLPILLLALLFPFWLFGQSLQSFVLQDDQGLTLQAVAAADKSFTNLPDALPLFSFVLNEEERSSQEARTRRVEDAWQLTYPQMQVTVNRVDHTQGGQKLRVLFTNTSTDTLTLENVLPLSPSAAEVYITGLGDHWLSRTHLFRPGHGPVNVIVPDNAWELGYGSIPLNDSVHLSGLSRRSTWNEQAQRRRFETILLPQGTVAYHLWLDLFSGDWQEGLRLFFQERYLYDLDGSFDETLYQRSDLAWVRHAYAMHLIMAWDHQLYDHQKGGYQLESFLERGQRLYGGDAVIGLWPNWPTLGLDQRNQWDLFRDMPGGTDRLQELAQMLRRHDTRFFLSYNPWDESTRWEDHHAGMADMIAATSADGVVLDTEGKSTPERQEAADAVREGVVMYSEGMAVPKDMPGIVSGRVHNALYYPPMLNLNKLIRPDFAIFRVAELYKERIRREYALSYFNGYGTELNIFRPGRPDWIEEDYRFWGRTLRILRENTSNFVSSAYTPLYPTQVDSIYVNHWPLPQKEVFTIFSLRPAGHDGPLFRVPPKAGYHLVDVWRHEELQPDTLDGELVVALKIDGFSTFYRGTNNEGAVSGVAHLPTVLDTKRKGDYLTFSATAGDHIRIWPGNPTYEKEKQVRQFGIHPQTIRLTEHFGRYEGKFVIQVMQDGELLDERTIFLPHGTARLISTVERTPIASAAPAGMVAIPGGSFRMRVTYGDNFIPHPVDYPQDEVRVKGFYMDKHPVTNADFKAFLDDTQYQPLDTANFLKHWEQSRFPAKQADYPVIYVSYEDARAYARWAGKRLPTEIEWQYAAQTPDGREWPWAKDADVQREEQYVTNTLTVSKLQVDPELCNPGDGALYPVGTYPKGANPYGLEDLVGCVWQMTNDQYDNGTNYFGILKGGSYYLPASSWWYVEGGPRELTYSQKWLRVSPGFERNATTGFRCVVDKK